MLFIINRPSDQLIVWAFFLLGNLSLLFILALSQIATKKNEFDSAIKLILYLL